MTSTDIVRPSSGFDVAVIAPLADLAERICRTEFVPQSLRGKPEATLACMLTGEELGIKPMTTLQKVHVIEGRPGLAAELMRALILSKGHEIWIEEKTNTRVTVAGQRKGAERVSRVTWTADDVKRAGLDGRPNHKKFPRAMLTARATAELARDIFPDVIGGLYAVEELMDGFGFGSGDVVDIDPDTLEVAEPKTHTRSATKRAPAKTTGRKTPDKGPSASSTSAEKERPPAPPLPTPEATETIAAEPFPESTPEEEAEAQQAAEAKVFQTFAGSAEVPGAEETGEIAGEEALARLRAKRDQLDQEHQLPLRAKWQQAGLRSIKEGATGTLLVSQAPEAERLLDEAIAAQADVYDRRRKHVLATLAELGHTTDEERHAFISSATDGEVESSKALLGRHVLAINSLVDAVRAERSGADQ